MGKFKFISLVASSLLVNSLMAVETQTMFLESGWNLKGSKLNSAKVNGDNITNTLKYNASGWSQDKGDGTLSLNAGEGFWIKATKESAIFLKGDISSESVKFDKAGWHLATPIDGSLSLSTLNSENLSSIWTYKAGQWLDKDKMSKANITKIEVGDGFWVKTSKDNLTIDTLSATTTAVASGSIDLSSIINPVTGEAMGGRSLRDEVVNPLNGQVIPDEASVQVYEADDTSFSKPLLKKSVTINPLTGEYVIEKDNLNDSISNDEVVNPLTGKVIRVIAKKNDKNYELSALATDSKRVDVNPITTTIRTQIIDTIKTMFGEEFVKEMKENSSIMSAINSLASTLATKVAQDIKDSKLSLRQTDFETDKTPDKIINPLTGEEVVAKAEKEEKLKTQLKDSSSSTDVAQFENKVSYAKKEKIDTTNVDLTKSGTNVDFAILEYDIISTFAKMNLAVHDGNGRLVLFLPVPSEHFNKLPGEKFSKKVKKDDGSEFVVGNDPALRVIDLEKNLKNANGSEIWAKDLVNTLLYNPIVPYEVIKTLVKKDMHTTKLTSLGEFLLTQKDPYGEALVQINPMEPLIKNKVTLSSNPDESVKRIIKSYMEPIVASNLLWMQYDLLFNALDTKSTIDFMKLFGISKSDNVGNFINRFQDSKEFRSFLKDIGVPLITAIPPFAKDENAIQLKDGYQINENSTIVPKTGIALTNLVLSTSGLAEIIITKKKISEIIGEEFLPENVKDLADKEIWWAVDKKQMNEMDARDVDEIDTISWMKDFILALSTKLSGESINAETRFAKIISDVNNYVKAFEEKVFEREYNVFEEQLAKEAKVVNSVIKFQVVDFENNPIEAVSQITFIPHIENKKTGEIIALQDKSKAMSPVDSEARFKDTMILTPSEMFVNENGDVDENGKWRYLTDYNVKLTLSDGSEFFLDYPIALFPIEYNNLNFIYVNTNFGAEEFNTGMDSFSQQVLHNGDKVYYPLLDRDLAVYSEFKFIAREGIRFGVLAKDWEEQDKVWSSSTIQKPKESELIHQFDIGNGINEGALIMIDVQPKNQMARQISGKNTQLLMTIDYIDRENKQVSIYIEPMIVDKVENKVPTCFAQEKEITLPMRLDGTYPYPGDPDYPKECMGEVNKFVPTDCKGKEFPFDEAANKYYLPNEENKNTIFVGYDLTCMTDNNYFGDFQDKIKDKCDFNGDGNVDETEKQKCSNIMDNTTSNMPIDKCDTNKDGKVDETEKQQCANLYMTNGTNTGTTTQAFDKCDTNKDGKVDDVERQQCANMVTDGTSTTSMGGGMMK